MRIINTYSKKSAKTWFMNAWARKLIQQGKKVYVAKMDDEVIKLHAYR